MEQMRNAYTVVVGRPKGNTGYIGLNGKIILKWNLKK
jgi:hypothetical protein